jgi:hypothetical protein
MSFALFENSQAAVICPDKCIVMAEMSTEQWWNDTDGKTEVPGENPVSVALCAD